MQVRRWRLRPVRRVRATKLAGLALASATVAGGTLAGMAAFTAPAAQAATLVVTNQNDSGTGSLRAAIASAAPGDTITFASTVSGPIDLSSTLEITNNLTISGPGPSTVQIDGQNSVQVFIVDPGVTATITGLTIENGSGSSFSFGGGILNEGILTATDDYFLGNDANFGGAIANCPSGTQSCSFSEGTIGRLAPRVAEVSTTVNDDTFSENTAGSGGAIFNFGGLSATNDTFWSNNAEGAGGIQNEGGLDVTNATFVNNSFEGIDNDSGHGAVATLTNSLFAMNGSGSSNCGGGGFVDGGYNVEDENTCEFGSTSLYLGNGDFSGLNTTEADGLIFGSTPATLADNDGPTETVAIPPTTDDNSVSVAAFFVQSGCPDEDQRGVIRPTQQCSAGAFQVPVGGGPPSPPVTLSSTSGVGEITLTWAVPLTDNGAPVNCYQI